MSTTPLTDIPEGFSFTISRAIWLRGEGAPASKLLRVSDGKMCCVGICLRALGVPDEKLRGVSAAVAVQPPIANRLDNVLQSVAVNNSDRTHLYTINDEPTFSNREARIAADFAKAGITVTFED